MRDSEVEAAAVPWELPQLYEGSHAADQDHVVRIADME